MLPVPFNPTLHEPVDGERAVLRETLDAGGWVRVRAGRAAGMLHGPMQVFSADGVPAAEMHFRMGRRQGLQRLYDDEGRLVQEADFTDDLQHGLTRIWVEGRLLMVQSFVAGRLHGETLCHAENGEITARLRHVNGDLEGESLYFHEGCLVRRAVYRSGKLDGETVDYGPGGQPVQSARYEANVLHGMLRRFWPGGQVMEQVSYRAGKPFGDIERFSAEGVKAGSSKGESFMNRFEKIVRG